VQLVDDQHPDPDATQETQREVLQFRDLLTRAERRAER